MRRWFGVLCAACLAWGCVAGDRSSGSYGQQPFDSREAKGRDEARATELVEEAGQCSRSDPERSERLLRQALDADLFHAKAHNNLGVLLLAKDDLYGAATEFEWARKLLPGHPEPRVNLAITLERAGQQVAAAESYRSALEVYPGYVPAIQGAARIAVRDGRGDVELERWLEVVAMSGDTPAWRDWARAKLTARSR